MGKPTHSMNIIMFYANDLETGFKGYQMEVTSYKNSKYNYLI